MSAAQKILERVSGVRQTAPGRWLARCPAHEDKSPSLSIREQDDGRILAHCFAGCPNGDVLAAIGLRMSDLFDKPIAHHLPPIRGGFNSRELIELNAHEATVVMLLAERAAAGEALTPEELQRLRQAAGRLGKAQALVNGH